MNNKKILNIGVVCTILSPVAIVVSCSSNNAKIDDNEIENEKKHENTQIQKNLEGNNLTWDNQKINKWTSLEFKVKLSNKNLLNEFTFKNKDKFFIGDINEIKNSNDLDAKILDNEDSTLVKLEVTVKENRWYKDNKIQITSLKQEVEITGFKTLPSSLNSEGGRLNDGKLNSSSYKQLMNLFNLKEMTPLTSLNNDFFNNILIKVDKFKNLHINILSGKTSEGKIVLELNGTYENNTIDKTQITITGFKIFKASKIKVVDLPEKIINKNNWFEKLLPITNSDNLNEIASIKSSDWISSLINDNISIHDESNNEVIGKISELKNVNNFTFNVSSTLINNNTAKFNLKINGTYKNGEYKNNSWVTDDNASINFEQATNNKLEIDIPTEDDLKEFLISKVEIDENHFINNYPSYYLGLGYWNKNNHTDYISANNFLKNIWFDKVKVKYSKVNFEGFGYGINVNEINADDFRNTLSFSVSLILEGSLNQKYNKRFDLENKNKNINENNKISGDIVNNVLIDSTKTDDNKKNLLAEKIVNKLKKEYKDLIDEMFGNNSSKTIKLNKDGLIPPILEQLFLRYDDKIDNIKDRIDQIEKHIDLSVFNKSVSVNYDNTVGFQKTDELNLYTKLFSFNQNERFVVESLIYKFQNSLTIEIEGSDNPNLLQIKLEGATSVGFSGDVEKTYKTNFNLTLLKSKWEKIIP